MADKDEGVEERYVGGRLFRKMSDGQIVEVNIDGSVEQDFTVGGRSFDSQTASFHSMVKARDNVEASGEPKQVEGSSQANASEPRAPGEPVPPVDPAELSMQEKMRQYLNRDKGPSGSVDPRLQGAHGKTNIMFSGSVKNLLDDAPKATSIGGMHSLSNVHGLAGGTGVSSNRVDPLRQLLTDRKPTSYKEHRDKVAAAFSKGSKLVSTSKSRVRPLRGR